MSERRKSQSEKDEETNSSFIGSKTNERSYSANNTAVSKAIK